MPDDDLLEARSTRSRSPVPGDRATGGYYYRFTLQSSRKLRRLLKEERVDFHLEVWGQIFGPRLTTIPFRLEDLQRLSAPKRLLDGETFTYQLSVSAVESVGLLPRVPGTAVDRSGRPIDDVSGYGVMGELIATLDKGPKEIADIVQGHSGFSIDDSRLWNPLDETERTLVSDALKDIVELIAELDEVALVELLNELPPVYMEAPSTRRHRSINLQKLNDFRRTLRRLKERAETSARRGRLAEFDTALESASLLGCHDLYFKHRELAKLDAPNQSAEQYVHHQPRRAQLNREIAAIHREKGFRYDTLDKLEAAFILSFEKRATEFARRQLRGYLMLFEHHVARTDSAAMMQAVSREGAGWIEHLFDSRSLRSRASIEHAIENGRARMDKLRRRFPLIRYVNFWTLVAKARPSQNSEFSVAHFNLMVAKTQRSIAATLEKLEEPGYVWKGDILIEKALVSFGMYSDPSSITHNAMLTDIVQRRQTAEHSPGIFKEIVLAVIALALSFSGVGLLVLAGVVLSVYDVYDMIGNQREISRWNLAGFSSETPPSDYWILLAVVGTGADVGGLLKLAGGARSVRSVKEVDELLLKAEITSTRARDAALAAREIRLQMDRALRELMEKGAKRSYSAGGLAGSKEVDVVAYHLARLGVTKFEHFLLELSHRRIIPKSRQDLSPKDVEELRAAYRRGLRGARNELESLDELLETERLVSGQLAGAERRASLLFTKRFASGVKRDLEDKLSPYTALRDKHHAAMRLRDRLGLKLREIRARIRQLRPRDDRTPMQWGHDAEILARFPDGREAWRSLRSKTTKSVDGIRKGVGGGPEVMQSKAVVHPKDTADLIKKIEGKIRQSERNFRSDKYARLVKQFNGGTIPVSSVDVGVELPKVWNDPAMRIYLEIPVITRARLDIEAARTAVKDLFGRTFPANAVLNVRAVTEEEIVSALARFGSS